MRGRWAVAWRRAALLWLIPWSVAQTGASQTGGGAALDRSWEDDLFPPLFAAPREIASYFSVLSWKAADLDSRIASMGVGDAFPLLHWGRARAAPGAPLPPTVTRGRVAIEFGVLAQFDLDGPSFDFVNADFFVGLPVSVRRGDTALRGRFYHWSAHLGDEFLLRSGLEREEVSVEAIELLISRDIGALRVIGGGTTRLRRFPKALGTRILRGGVELRPERELFAAGPIGGARAIAAADLRLTNADGWETGLSVKAGLRIDPRDDRDGEGSGGRSWSLVLEFFDGPSPYGQFFRTRLHTVGVGLHLH